MLGIMSGKTGVSCQPSFMPDCHVYNSDGACRMSESGRKASSGVLLRYNEITLAELGVYLGDASNNEAEYDGVLRALQHAVSMIDHSSFCFRVDSLLVARQLQGLWRCRAVHLHAVYEACLDLLKELRSRHGHDCVKVEHVYREFNASADALANEVLNEYNPRQHANGVVVNRAWQP